MLALRRTILPALVLVGLLSPGTSSAAAPTVSASADVGTVAVAQAAFRTRGGAKTPKLALTRRASLPAGALVLGGVRKLDRVPRGMRRAVRTAVAAAARAPGVRPDGRTTARLAT